MVFADLLEERVSEMLASNAKEVEVDVGCLYKAPSYMATKFQSMWAFGHTMPYKVLFLNTAYKH